MIPVKKPRLTLTPDQEAEKAKILEYMKLNKISLIPYSQQRHTGAIGTIMVEGITIMEKGEFYDLDISSNGEISNGFPSNAFMPLQDYILKCLKQVGYVYLNPFFSGLLT